MCVKFPPRDLNLGPYLPHRTRTYTCGGTIAILKEPNSIGKLIHIKYLDLFNNAFIKTLLILLIHC